MSDGDDDGDDDDLIRFWGWLELAGVIIIIVNIVNIMMNIIILSLPWFWGWLELAADVWQSGQSYSPTCQLLFIIIIIMITMMTTMMMMVMVSLPTALDDDDFGGYQPKYKCSCFWGLKDTILCSGVATFLCCVC